MASRLQSAVGLLARRTALAAEARAGGGVLSCLTSSSTASSSGSPSSLQQRRGAVEVTVTNNAVDSALKALRRKLSDEGMTAAWREQEFHIKGAERRKLEAAETRTRLRQAERKRILHWILKRKQKGT